MVSSDEAVVTFTNSGTMNIDDTFDTNIGDAIYVEGATFHNYGSLNIDNSGNDGIQLEEDDDGLIGNFTNYNGATIVIENSADDGIELSDDSGNFLNNGILTINTFDDAGIDLQSNSSFTNDRNITMSGGAGGTTIGVDQTGGRFENNCTVDISDVEFGIIISGGTFSNISMLDVANTAASTEAAFETASQFTNGNCGIFNILSDNEINIQATGSISNNGVITTAFTGTNTHDGTFTNNGAVRPSSYSPAPSGNAPTDGDVPATEPLNPSVCSMGCPVTGIPTLSEWGLLILALLLMTLGTVYLIQPNTNLLEERE